jgi:hypothetical protein|tara:strand:- start:1720 stop:2946 length:1227 start_codon:yes stop_codon:yes gene_type:complete
MKANTLVYLIDEVSLNRFLATSGFMLEKMSKNFKEIFILNFVDYKKKFNFFIDLNKEVKAEKKEVSPFKLPKNIKLINIKSDKDFTKFCIYRNVIGIDLLGRRLVDLPIHLLLAKNDVKLIQISNIGNIQFTLKIDKSSLIKGLKYHLDKKVSKYLYYLLANLFLIPKIEIRFISNANILENINNNLIKKIFHKYKFFITKRIINVNSISFDQFHSNKNKLSENYIVFLDHDLASPDDQYFGHKKINEKKHFTELKVFLEDLSQTFKKKVIVTIHPRDKLSLKKKIFSNFKVVKYQTRDYINKAFLVVFFESSAIVNAILLKKKIITITSDYLNENLKLGSKRYQNQVGIYHLNVQNRLNFDKKTLIKELNKSKVKYKNFINTYIGPDKNRIGYKKIIKIMKNELFKN